MAVPKQKQNKNIPMHVVYETVERFKYLMKDS